MNGEQLIFSWYANSLQQEGPAVYPVGVFMNLITLSQLAIQSGVCGKTIRRAMRKGKIPKPSMLLSHYVWTEQEAVSIANLFAQERAKRKQTLVQT